MRFEEDLKNTAFAVARLLVRQEDVPAQELDIALGAHATLVQLLQQLHYDVTGISPLAAPQRQVSDLDRHPVALLGRLLAEQPQSASLSLTDVLTRLRSPVGQSWTDLARQATLAQHEWATADPASIPRGDGAWTVIGAVARLAEGAAALTGDLACCLKSQGRHDEADVMDRAAGSGLGPAAREVATLARRGPAGAVELTPRDATRAVVVIRPSDLPRALRRAAALIGNSRYLSPQHVERLAVAHVRTMLWVADGLEGAPCQRDGRDTAQALRQHARVVAATARNPRRLATVNPSDESALTKLSQIRQLTRGQPASRVAVSTLRACAPLFPDVTGAISMTVESQLAAGRWLTNAGDGTWRGLGIGDPTAQELLQHWRTSAHHALQSSALTPVAPERQRRRQEAATPAMAIAAALEGRPAVRPPRPASALR